MAATTRPRLLVPGLVPSTRRGRLPRAARGGDGVSLRPDDRLTVRDLDGGQRAELTVSPRRARGLSALGPGRGAPATVLRSSSRSRGRGRPSSSASSRAAGSTRRGPRSRALRPHVAARRRGDVPRRARRRRGRRGARRSAPVVEGGMPASDLQLEIRRARLPRRARAPSCPSRSPSPRLDFQVDRASALAYEVKAGRVRPGHRRARPPVLRLPRLQRAQAAGRQGARPRLDRDALADGQRLPEARALLEVLRPRPRAARRGRAGHGRPPRHLRPRVHREVLRGHGLLRPRQLLGQLQRGADAVHDRAAQGLAGDQLLLQHRVRRAQPVRRRRAVVASRRLRPAAGDDRPRAASRARARTTSTRPTRGTRPRCTCASTRPRSASRPRSPTA